MGRYLRVPFHMTPLLLVATFTVGMVIAVHAGMGGIPLAIVLVSWFFKYCFVLLDSIVAGEDEPPVLAVEMVNPLSEQRPLLAAGLIGGECALVVSVHHHLGWLGGFIAGAAVIL